MIVERSAVFKSTEQLKTALDQGGTLAVIVTWEPLEGGNVSVLSHYEDSTWTLPRALFPKVVHDSERILNFDRIPAPLRDAVRHVMLTRLLPGDLRGASISLSFDNIALHPVPGGRRVRFLQSGDAADHA